jgi:hypothetical protein
MNSIKAAKGLQINLLLEIHDYQHGIIKRMNDIKAKMAKIHKVIEKLLLDKIYAIHMLRLGNISCRPY